MTKNVNENAKSDFVRLLAQKTDISRNTTMMSQYKNRMFQTHRERKPNLDQSGLQNKKMYQGLDTQLTVKIYLEIGLVKSYINIILWGVKWDLTASQKPVAVKFIENSCVRKLNQLL